MANLTFEKKVLYAVVELYLHAKMYIIIHNPETIPCESLIQTLGYLDFLCDKVGIDTVFIRHEINQRDMQKQPFILCSLCKAF